MAEHGILIDRSIPLAAEPDTGHNRWHPDIEPRVVCQPGDDVVLETRDAFDLQFHSGAKLDDVNNVDLNLVHPLTGPVYIEGAEPGDLLVVDILEVSPSVYGYTVQVPGFGFLRDEFPDPFLVKWDIEDMAATSRDLGGVRVPGAPFMGVMGVAPSRELMARIAAREQAPREPDGAVPSDAGLASEALRTIAPREIGGNMHIKQTAAGARLFMPVWTVGALFSAGDAHFAQGDGEVCGTAIEMGATFRARFDLRKGVAAERGIRDVQFERDSYVGSPEYHASQRFFATTGISETVNLAARNALLNMIDHLESEYGYSRQQAYVICSVGVDLKVSHMVDASNCTVAAFLPLEMVAGPIRSSGAH